MSYALSFVASCFANALNVMTTMFNGIPGAWQVLLAGFTIFMAGRFLLIPISGAFTGQLSSDIARVTLKSGETDKAKPVKRKVSGKRGTAKKG